MAVPLGSCPTERGRISLGGGRVHLPRSSVTGAMHHDLEFVTHKKLVVAKPKRKSRFVLGDA